MGIKRWGAIWGFAEATVFFIVPDVLITYAALTKTRTFIVWLCLYTLIGALVGGTLMYALGIGFVKEGNELLTHIPAIDAQLVADVQQSLIESGSLPCSSDRHKAYRTKFLPLTLIMLMCPFGYL
ncbi:hypothetical protein JCM19037_749 [Geomicrobium sp. JCM 19037]|uniref:hypothetical protein n=1 Tax=Geomicrobium sp. JCM 19037 TaxID=1460634 RepID=UPI00045F4A55|nr:hypothetical protein [Geomicrobium sp. JCM 19037]GAK02510.1 hypothetical protein JCM19037_749 [Geomicrobium sp. JCM 19037]